MAKSKNYLKPVTRMTRKQLKRVVFAEIPMDLQQKLPPRIHQQASRELVNRY